MYLNARAKLLDTIEKLSRLTTARGATPDEAAAAKRKIKIIQAKVAALPAISRVQPIPSRFIWKTQGETIRTKTTPDRVYVERHRHDCCCGKHPDEYISKHYVWETRDGWRTSTHVYKEKPPTPQPAPKPQMKPEPAPEQNIFPNYNDLQNRYRIHE